MARIRLFVDFAQRVRSRARSLGSLEAHVEALVIATVAAAFKVAVLEGVCGSGAEVTT